MGMTNTARELKKNMEDMMDVCKKKLGGELLDDDYVDAEAIEFMRSMFKMCDVAMELMVQQAETLDAMNEKLDKLVEKS